MKAILKFDMYEEAGAFDDARHGTAYRVVLQELDETLKRWEDSPDNNDETRRVIGDVRDTLSELLNEKDLTLWD